MRALDKAAFTATPRKGTSGTKTRAESELTKTPAEKTRIPARTNAGTRGLLTATAILASFPTKTPTVVATTTPDRAEEPFTRIRREDTSGMRIRRAKDTTGDANKTRAVPAGATSDSSRIEARRSHGINSALMMNLRLINLR